MWWWNFEDKLRSPFIRTPRGNKLVKLCRGAMINNSSQLAGQKMAMVLLCICRADSTESTKQSLMRDVGQCCQEELLLLKALWML